MLQTLNISKSIMKASFLAWLFMQGKSSYKDRVILRPIKDIMTIHILALLLL
jgi:hypothetical protein